jgi:hypothetical protein
MPTDRTSPPVWIGVLLPSATDLLFLILLFSWSTGALAPRLLGDAGIGWHIRNGQQMLHSHSITRVDQFSASMSGHVWYAWEWLYDAIIAVIHDHIGLNGVVLLTALLIAVTFALTMRLTITRGAGLPVAITFTVLAAGASTIHFLARPHVVSWLFTVIWFAVLDDFESRPRRSLRVYCLPLIILAWVNLHGGFVVGFVLLGIFLVSSAAASFNGDPEQYLARLKQLGIVTVLCAAASFVNPYGYKLHVHVYQYLTDRFLMDHIDEFLSPNFHGIAQQCFVALLLLAVVALAARKQSPRVSEILVLLFATYSGLFASRNLPVSSILITLVAAPILSHALAAAGTLEAITLTLRAMLSRFQSFSSRMTTMELRSRGHLWPLLAFTILLWICANGGVFGSRQIIHTGFDSKRFPVGATNYLGQQNIQAPIFTPDSWGGYLIYRLYPHNQVVVDDRHDLYGDQFLKQYLKTIRVEPGWSEFLEQRDNRWAVLPSESSLANLLEQLPQWKIAYRDETSTLFQRR